MLTMEELGYFVYMNEVENQQSQNEDEAENEEQTAEDSSEQ